MASRLPVIHFYLTDDVQISYNRAENVLTIETGKERVNLHATEGLWVRLLVRLYNAIQPSN